MLFIDTGDTHQLPLAISLANLTRSLCRNLRNVSLLIYSSEVLIIQYIKRIIYVYYIVVLIEKGVARRAWLIDIVI